MATVSSTTLTTGKNLPSPQSPFTEPKTGVLTNDGYEYFISLINQLATAVPTVTVASGLAAQGLSQATALQLASGWNEIDTATATDDGVILSPLQPGQSQTVFNQSGIAINVYPPPGFAIDALGINTPFSLGNGARQAFDFISDTQIRS